MNIEFRIAIAAASAALFSACSPGIFFGSGPDARVENAPRYKQINTQCSGLRMSSGKIDVPTLKGLLDCFNANGALANTDALVHRLDRDDPAGLQQVVDLLNDYVIKQTSFFELSRTYATLQERGLAAPTFYQLGKLLENKEFLANALAVMNDAYSSGAKGDILQVLHAVSGKLTNENLGTAMDTGILLTNSEALSSFEDHLRAGSLSDADLELLTDNLLAFSKADHPVHLVGGRESTLGRELIAQLVNDNLFQALDAVLGKTPDELRTNVPELAGMLSANLQRMPGVAGPANVADPNGYLMNDMASLFSSLDGPISCLKGSEAVPNADMFVIDEMSRKSASTVTEFIQRENMLTLVVMNPLCTYPAALKQDYPTLVYLSNEKAIEPVWNLIHSFYSIDQAHGNGEFPLSRSLIGLLGDVGPDGKGGARLVVPALAQLNARAIAEPGRTGLIGPWEDGLLMAALVRDEDRQKLKDALAFLTAPLDALQGRSPYDVLISAVGQTDPLRFFKLVASMRPFIDSTDPLIGPSLKAVRSAYYVNDVHPVTDMLRNVLADAPTKQKLFDTIFEISAWDEFPATLGELSQLGENGDLNKLVGATLTLFQRYANGGSVAINDVTEPPLSMQPRHYLASKDLVDFNWAAPESFQNAACSALDVGFPMDAYTRPGYAQQLGNTLSCLNAPGGFDDLVASVNFLNGPSAQTSDPSKTLFDTTIDLIKGLNLDAPAAGWLTNSFLATYGDGRFDRITKALSYLVHDCPPSQPSCSPAPVLKPLLDLAAPVMNKAKAGFERLQAFLGRELPNAYIPGSLRYLVHVNDLVNPDAPDDGSAAPAPYDPSTQDVRPPVPVLGARDIEQQVLKSECDDLPVSGAAQYAVSRARQVIDDATQAATLWDPLPSGMLKRTWVKSDFHQTFDPVLTQIGDPTQSTTERPLVQALLNFMGYFTLPDSQTKPQLGKHFHADYIAKWLRDRSVDYRLITYMYPNDMTPHVRMVNTLDALELMLINADFYAPFPITANKGLDFLAQLANSWGDEDPSVWPDEIKKAYAGGRPPTIAETAQAILSFSKTVGALIGYPELPDCDPLANASTMHLTIADGSLLGLDIAQVQRSLYNISQLVYVMSDNVPTAKDAGLKVLRDLFFELYYSTPAKYRTANLKDADKFHNNLSLIVGLVRGGVTHQIGLQMARTLPGDPEVQDLFQGLIRGANTAGMADVIRALLTEEPSHKLVWSVIDQILDLVNAGQDVADMAPSYQQQLKGLTAAQIAAVKAGWQLDRARMKQLAFYLLAGVPSLEGSRPGALLGPLLNTGARALRVERGYLETKSDKVADLLRSKLASNAALAMYDDRANPAYLDSKMQGVQVVIDAVSDPQNGVDAIDVFRAIDEDPNAHGAIDAFSDRLDALKLDPQYKALKLSELTDSMLTFLEESSDDPNEVHAAQQARLGLASSIAAGDLEQFLSVAGKSADNENRLYAVLQTLAHHIDNGQLKDFMGLVYRSLKGPGH